MREGLLYDIMVDMDERPEGWNKELYDKLSHDFLITCAQNDGIEEWNQAYEAYLRSEWGRRFPSEGYDSENIGKLFDNRSGFVKPDFQDEDFTDEIRKKANFSGVHLEGADFHFAHLEGARFNSAHLEGAEFILAIVDGETLFFSNTIDDKSDFTGTSLSSARIEPELRTQLERNIRQLRWEQWYTMPKFYPDLAEIKTKLISKFSSGKIPEKKNWETKHSWVDRIINAFVRLFWWISNYGSSTKRVIAVFFGWNLMWALIYQYILPLQTHPILAGAVTTVLDAHDFIIALLQTNLMMFSITDLAAIVLDYPALLCVTIHIVVGYFILAALITRLGIMFQNLSP